MPQFATVVKSAMWHVRRPQNLGGEHGQFPEYVGRNEGGELLHLGKKLGHLIFQKSNDDTKRSKKQLGVITLISLEKKEGEFQNFEE